MSLCSSLDETKPLLAYKRLRHKIDTRLLCSVKADMLPSIFRRSGSLETVTSESHICELRQLVSRNVRALGP